MSRFRSGRRDVQRDIDDEVRFHLDARIEELVGQGLPPDEARAQALAEFGDVNDVRSDLRAIDVRLARRRTRGDLLEGIAQDLVYSVRSLGRTPAVSLTIILTLALGLGVNAAMFSLLDAIFLRPPAGVPNAAEVRRLWSYRVFRDGPRFWSGFDYAAYAALGQALAGKADLAIYGIPTKVALGRGETPPMVNVASASASLFPLLGVRPARGRLYGADEDGLDAAAPVVVISDAFWKREFGGDRGAIGREIILGGHPFTIIGVTLPRFSGIDLDAADVWRPLAANPAYSGVRGNARTPWYRNPNINGFQILVRPAVPGGEIEQRSTIALRRPGIGFRQDTTTVAKLGSIIEARGPGEISDEIQVAERVGGVAIIVLLIAFANVVNLLLARAVRRGREIAVRLALGISTARLVRLLVTESVLLSLAAAAGALAAAWWGGSVLRGLLMPGIRWAEDPLHWRVLLFGVAVAVVAGVAAGLVPALQSRAPDLTKALKSGTREGGPRRSRLRGFLIASQAALSVVLLVGAVLFVRSLRNVRGLDIGYTVNRLAFVSVERAPGRPTDLAANANQAMSDRLRLLEERIASIPGVEGVAYTSMRPKWGIQFLSYFVEGDTGSRFGFYSAVSPGFFAVTGTRVVRGRTFSSGAAGRTEQAVMVNQAMADSLWPNRDPLGRCIRVEKRDAPCLRVIGVTQNSLVIGVKENPEPKLYVPLDNMPFPSWGVGDVVLRADPARLTSVTNQVRALLRAEFPGRSVQTNTMSAAMEPEYRPWRLGATLFSLFGALAALVAAIGIFSTVSYAVSQRSHEFGVRAALGARAGTIVRQVIGEGLRSVTIGVALGIALALAAGRVLASLLYGVSPADLAAMSIAAVALLVLAAAASFAPAWRAANADPIAVLRVD
jgi:predicted permease